MSQLEQLCPACGRREAAGSYCTGCFRPMSTADWRQTLRTKRQVAALGRVHGQSRPERAATAKKTASPATLGLGL